MLSIGAVQDVTLLSIAASCGVTCSGSTTVALNLWRARCPCFWFCGCRVTPCVFCALFILNIFLWIYQNILMHCFTFSKNILTMLHRSPLQVQNVVRPKSSFFVVQPAFWPSNAAQVLTIEVIGVPSFVFPTNVTLAQASCCLSGQSNTSPFSVLQLPVGLLAVAPQL